jgi:hypothetical protein
VHWHGAKGSGSLTVARARAGTAGLRCFFSFSCSLGGSAALFWGSKDELVPSPLRCDMTLRAPLSRACV